MLPMYRPENSRHVQVQPHRPKHLHRDMRRSCVNQLQLSLNEGWRFDSRSRIGAGRLRSNFEPKFIHQLWSASVQTRHGRNVWSTHLQAPLGHDTDRDASISRVGLPLPEITPGNQELAGGLILHQLRTTCSLLSWIFDVLVCLK